MLESDIAAHRLYQQRLSNPDFKTPTEMVSWLGAVQSQEYLLALWAVGMRMQHATHTIVEQAFNEGAILRTHVMRPTWHFVAPADIRWLLELTAPRVHALNAHMYRKLELDDMLLVQAAEVIAKALEGGNALTRLELGAALEQAGIATDGMRLGYIVHYAELERIICSGPRHGKQFTYMLLDERAPNARSLPREEALAELIKRYFTSHGPATVHDFAWWSGLTIADTKAGLEMNKPDLVEEVIDDLTYWRAASLPAVQPIQDPSPTAHLLAPYDEYVMYRHHRGVLYAVYLQKAKRALFGGIIVLDGQMVGNWRRTFVKDKILIESDPYRPFTEPEQDALVTAAKRYGEFMGMPVELA